ncbi:hypothetical protein [Streptomyces sp. NPDC051310]|uniref:hypothetical protein n=1 Tax=Streptomyces sp. NPDC051310 TaxID=3365649 RepID=UPI0037B4E209
MPLIEHGGRDYALQIMYALPDDAWYLELYDVPRHRLLALAIVPDEDPRREPTVCFHPGPDPDVEHHEVPYEVMRWFLDQVEAEIRTSRGWMRLRPRLVEIVRQLREIYQGGPRDEEYPALTVILRELVAEEELAPVLEGAFGELPDPGLPEASPAEVAALRARLAGDGWTIPADDLEGSGTTYE